MGIPDGDLSPRGTGMGKKCPLQAFVGIPAGKFFCHGDGFGELKPDGEFPVSIPTPAWSDLILYSTSSLLLNVTGRGIVRMSISLSLSLSGRAYVGLGWLTCGP
jgi:hypothetical protein